MIIFPHLLAKKQNLDIRKISFHSLLTTNLKGQDNVEIKSLNIPGKQLLVIHSKYPTN